MKKIKNKTFFIVLSCYLLFGCSNNNVNRNAEDSILIKNVQKEVIGESFEEFSNKFFNDLEFQVSRIKFPLRGNSTDYVFDEENKPDVKNDTFMVSNKKFYWRPKGWVFLKEVDSADTTLVVELKREDDFVSKIVKSKNEDFVIVMDFKLIEGRWYMVYYSSEWH